MNEQPLVSVVIATYNMGHYLPEAIQSVLDQSWQALEVVVVDDGSTDNTAEAMQAFATDERVRYIPTGNQGQPRAKNRGLEEARGDFIAFCDADDLWSRRKLELQMAYFDDPAVGVVYSEVSYIDQEGAHINKAQPYERHSGRVTEQLIIKNFVPFGTAVIRRACVEKNGRFDESLPMGIDWDLWLRYSVDWDFQYVNDVTYIYRIWAGQMSKNYRGRYDNAFLILEKFLSANPNVIPERLESRAWADMYISRGMSIAAAEKSFLEPFLDVGRGLLRDCFYWQGWRSLAKLMLRRV
ncbi:glycosyltransferase family 2 protein [Marinobacter sp. JSM 1782161]|uniref:glycosyltransferase family 2 protein n=1 Tax=Marinobacter sp. JSM 1782161 TaxID=2685906 RepID=UPI00140217C0|nr:glycosyltransferase family 2 protein [Marinobacter sp. JSM 1782161]